MKIAFCLYGQPRNHVKGFDIISDFLSNQQNVEVDFFYHTWTVTKDETYNYSWSVDPNDITCREYIIDVLNDLYKPKAYAYEPQISTFDTSLYENTIAYRNTCEFDENSSYLKLLPIINNTVSEAYSRNKVCNLLEAYIESNNVTYDFVIMCRFDFKKNISIQLSELDPSCAYISDMHKPRALIPDNFIIAPTDLFLKWFKLFDNFEKVLDSAEMDSMLKYYDETLLICMEQMVFAHYLYHAKTLDKLMYVSTIP